MPSPIAHIAMGYAIYRFSWNNLLQGNQARVWLFPRLFIVTVVISMLPDLDSIMGIFMSDFGRFHNNGTHSLVIGLIMALAFASIVRWRFHLLFATWFAIALISYEMHVIMDFFTVGRGVMLLWPFSTTRFASPLKLFYGLHWSEGWISIKHLWTLVTEIGFFLLLIIVVNLLERIRYKATQ